MSHPRSLLRFLGSMNLAIALLAVIAIAAIIGTIVIQNRADQHYLSKFGPLWHEIYQLLGLYDVYSSSCFLAFLFFLIVSIVVCLFRHGPIVIRQLRSYHGNISEATICALHHHAVFYSRKCPDQITDELHSILTRYRYRVRISKDKIVAIKGASNRLGYFFTHISIVIICMGGLLDSKIGLKWMIAQDELVAHYDDDSLLAKIPAQSRLDSSTTSFQGNVMLPEGKAANFCFINVAGGYVLQELPFTIELESFRIEHYSSGQPKSFASDLVIHDPITKERTEKTIQVNHPLRYQGYTIYQASFSDGGSLVEFDIHPLRDSKMEKIRLNGTIKDTIPIDTPKGLRQLELTGFRKFNVFRDEYGDFIDHGPSLEFRLINNDGSAHELQNYMYPVQIEGRYFMLSSIQPVGATKSHYLYIPVDQAQSLQRFFDFHRLLFDDVLLSKVTRDAVAQFSLSYKKDKKLDQLDLGSMMMELVQLFREGGLDSIERYVLHSAPEGEYEQALAVHVKLLQFALNMLYRHLPEQQASTSDAALEVFDEQLFFKDAVNSFSVLHQYAAPVYIAFQKYQHKQASGLQITKAPGAKWIFLGFFMLVVGVFLLFYIKHQRLWLKLVPLQANTKILIGALSMHKKNNKEFITEFYALSKQIKQYLQ